LKTLMKKEKNYSKITGKKCIFGESDNEGAFVVLRFIFGEQAQFNMFIYTFVENSSGYPNISLLFQKC
jgi:hypothetical protein